MTLLTRLRFLLRNLFGGRRADRALEAELQSSIELQVSPIDPATTVAVALVVALTAIVAVSHPAWRAGQTDPNVALRAD